MASFIQTIDTAMKALVFNKFKDYLTLTDQNTGVVFAPKQVAMRKVAEKRGEASVEFISLWRTSLEHDWARNNTAIARRGLQLQYSNSITKVSIVTAKAVPVKITYEVRIWSRDLNKLACASESYLKWKYDYPQLFLNYLGLYPMEMYLKFGAVVDETDYDIYENGLYFVYMFPISLDGWVLDKFSFPTVLEIILDIYLREGAAPNYTDTLLEEYIITAGP